MRRFLANLVDFFKPRCWYDVLCYVTAFPFALALFWAIAFPEFRGWSIDLQGSALDVATSAYGVATLLVGIAGFILAPSAV